MTKRRISWIVASIAIAGFVYLLVDTLIKVGMV